MIISTKTETHIHLVTNGHMVKTTDLSCNYCYHSQTWNTQ